MKVTKDISWVGVLDPDLRMFDVVIPTELGTTYNSYLIKADKPCLIDTVKAEFSEEFLDRLEQEIDLADLKYLVVNHTEPDHSGSVQPLLERAPHIEVYGSRAAIQFLRQQVQIEFKSVVVTDNDILDLGNKQLKFIMAPFLHWPDTMFTYLEEQNILFTCDGFGSHYSPDKDRLFESDLSDFTPAIKHYYDSIMSPFKPKILEAIAKIKDLNIDLIATGHGPILDKDPWRVIKLYEQWSDFDPQAKKKIVIGYASAYGHTKQMAELIAEGIKTESSLNVTIMDVANTSEAELQAELASFDGIIVGSPTINADVVEPVWRFISYLNGITAKGKLASAFGNYGWSGEAVELLENRLERMRLALVQPGLKIRFGLAEADQQACREFGANFAEAFVVKSS